MFKIVLKRKDRVCVKFAVPLLVQDETLKKSQSLAFRVNSDFSTVITSLDDA